VADAAQNGGMDVSKRTIHNALADLTDAGLVKERAYRQHRGRLKTLTALGARVASRS
jgi:DNA-binding transcriptional ArsR family regulator